MDKNSIAIRTNFSIHSNLTIPYGKFGFIEFRGGKGIYYKCEQEEKEVDANLKWWNNKYIKLSRNTFLLKKESKEIRIFNVYCKYIIL